MKNSLEDCLRDYLEPDTTRQRAAQGTSTMLECDMRGSLSWNIIMAHTADMGWSCQVIGRFLSAAFSNDSTNDDTIISNFTTTNETSHRSTVLRAGNRRSRMEPQHSEEPYSLNNPGKRPSLRVKAKYAKPGSSSIGYSHYRVHVPQASLP